jgi:hypothetical protein
MSEAIGSIVAYAGPRTPKGYLPCDGKTYDRTNALYKPLFDAIGTSWGGDGVNLFRVPDLRGLFLRGVDAGAGRDPEAKDRQALFPGDKNPGNKGDAVGSHQGDQFRNHVHGQVQPYGIGADRQGQRDGWYGESVNKTTGESGSGGTETRPRNVAVYWIIRYQAN